MCRRPSGSHAHVSRNASTGVESEVVHVPSKNASAPCGSEGVAGVVTGWPQAQPSAAASSAEDAARKPVTEPRVSMSMDPLENAAMAKRPIGGLLMAGSLPDDKPLLVLMEEGVHLADRERIELHHLGLRPERQLVGVVRDLDQEPGHFR
jgi:hypothetical protein